MNQTVFTVKDLMERWNSSKTTIYDMYYKGEIQKAEGLRGIKFTYDEVLRVEGLQDINPLSTSERRKLEAEIKSKDNEIVKLKQILANILGCTGEYAVMWAKGEFN